MPFLRVTRDDRGYEHTYLLHASYPGERPQVLYWYRTAPGVRVGRAALDEDAIRTIEARHPDLAFDWSLILETAALAPPEPERRPDRPRRRVIRPREDQAPSAPYQAIRVEATTTQSEAPAVSPVEVETRETAVASGGSEPAGDANPLVAELAGREIASRLRARYDELAARLSALAPSDRRDALTRRARHLDPDGWLTPEAVLHGVQHADRLFDDLRRELDQP